jgi:hypothetical protein
MQVPSIIFFLKYAEKLIGHIALGDLCWIANFIKTLGILICTIHYLI